MNATRGPYNPYKYATTTGPTLHFLKELNVFLGKSINNSNQDDGLKISDRVILLKFRELNYYFYNPKRLV